MSRELRLSDNLTLPLDAVTQTFAILAKRGVGKTYTASVMVEEMLMAGLHVVILDPVGVWWGLRSSVDGKGDGLPIVIMGGKHADVPLDKSSGAMVADMIISEKLPAILDLSDMSKNAQCNFVAEFGERLYQKNTEPLHLVLDEADAFAPQRTMPNEARMLGAIDTIVRRGRAKGLGATLITQRPAVLNKSVLTQVEVLITLRIIGPQDRAAIKDWVSIYGDEEQGKELLESLAILPIGDAWIWSPGWLDIFQRMRVRPRKTFDSSATPKVGSKKIEPKIVDIDLDAIRQACRLAQVAGGCCPPGSKCPSFADVDKNMSPEEFTKKNCFKCMVTYFKSRCDMPTCRICGCTDDFGCPGGCYWVEPDLCSECAKEAKP